MFGNAIRHSHPRNSSAVAAYLKAVISTPAVSEVYLNFTKAHNFLSILACIARRPSIGFNLRFTSNLFCTYAIFVATLGTRTMFNISRQHSKNPQPNRLVICKGSGTHWSEVYPFMVYPAQINQQMAERYFCKTPIFIQNMHLPCQNTYLFLTREWYRVIHYMLS